MKYKKPLPVWVVILVSIIVLVTAPWPTSLMFVMGVWIGAAINNSFIDLHNRKVDEYYRSHDADL